MSRVFTLESFAEESEKRFGSLTIGAVTFRQVLRLTDSEREEFTDKSKELNELHSLAKASQEAAEDQANVEALRDAGNTDVADVPQIDAPTPAEIRKVTLAMLRITTLEKEDFDEWSAALSDADIYTVLGLYSEDGQVGEA